MHPPAGETASLFDDGLKRLEDRLLSADDQVELRQALACLVSMLRANERERVNRILSTI